MKGRLQIVLLIVLVFFTVAGSAAKRRCTNWRFGTKLVAHFDPRKCHDIERGMWQCNDVIFEPGEIRAQGALEKANLVVTEHENDGRK